MKSVKATRRHKEATVTLHKGGHIDSDICDELVALGWAKYKNNGVNIVLTPEGEKAAQAGIAAIEAKRAEARRNRDAEGT